MLSLVSSSSPLLVAMICSILYSLAKAATVILCIWGPLGPITWAYVHTTLPLDDRDGIALLILLSPLLLAYGYLAVALTLVGLYFGLVLMQNISYMLLWWQWVFCRPRFRTPDPFAQSRLCEDYKDVEGKG